MWPVRQPRCRFGHCSQPLGSYRSPAAGSPLPHRPIRLDDLELASGLKARVLQLAFLRHLGRTPRQWILDRRLDAARDRLADPQSDRTVTSVALECGFTRPSSFTKAYKARFGELPRATVRRRRRLRDV